MVQLRWGVFAKQVILGVGVFLCSIRRLICFYRMTGKKQHKLVGVCVFIWIVWFGWNIFILEGVASNSDKTYPNKPFVVWLNDDQDNHEDGETVPVVIPDNIDTVIRTKRDLEDFQVLAIRIQSPQQIKDPSISVAVRWKEITGNPVIHLYKSYFSPPENPNSVPGCFQYLEDPIMAENQIHNGYENAIATIEGTSSVVLDKNLFMKMTDQNPILIFLFEGVSAGKGTLTLQLIQHGKAFVESDLIYMDLKKVTDMYSQAQALPVEGIKDPYEYFPEQPSAPEVSWQDMTSLNFQRPMDETNQCIIFVHGWNVSDKRFYQQANSMFKRLWLQGFKGRFVAFRWPSDVSGDDTWDIARTFENSIRYFDIEYRGFKYARALKDYISYLASPSGGGFTVNLVAHSMGNIVASEAIKLGAPVAHYVLMDGAVSAGCYDTQAELTKDPILKDDQGNPLSLDGFPTESIPDSVAQGGYRGYFLSLAGLTSFYNLKDEAMDWYKFGNSIKRNGVLLGDRKYIYDEGVKLDKQPSPPTAPKPNPRLVTDIHESMSMYAQSRTRPIGQEDRTRGVIAVSIDMQNYFKVGAVQNEDHSPQFDKPLQFNGAVGVKAYYQRILDELQIPRGQ